MLIFCSSLWADTHTFTSAGVNNLWSNAANWQGGLGVPVDTDAFNIPNGQTCEFDADLSLWAGLAASTIAAGGTLRATETAGSWVLKTTGDLTVAGTLQAGTSVAVPYPSTCTFTINFSNTAKSIERTATGSIKLYCTQPTNKYVTITEALDAVETEFDVDTNLTADGPWSISGAQVRIVDSTPLDSEIRTIAVGGVAVNGHVDVTAALTNTKSANSLMLLVTRNIRIINVAASDYAITYATGAGSGDYIGCEINDCYGLVLNGTGYEFAGVANIATVGRTALIAPISIIFSGVICGTTAGTVYGIDTGKSVTCTQGSLFAGITQGTVASLALQTSGLIFGCTYGHIASSSIVFDSLAVAERCSYGFYSVTGGYFYGTIRNNAHGIEKASGIIIGNATFTGNTTSDLGDIGSGSAYNTTFGGPTEFSGYNSTSRAQSSYLDSFDHDRQVNAFVAWPKGGKVTSDTTGCPLVQNGITYDRWYEHACEHTTPEYPCFRQYETTVQPGQTIEVVGWIRIADGEDFSDSGDISPRLQIIAKDADPLVDSTQSVLDEDIIASYDGTNTDRQDVSVIWANQGDAPRQVIVRMLCYSDQAAATDIDEAWAVATYQDQIADIWNKLPTNYIMGSSVQTDKDDEIDATYNKLPSKGYLAGTDNSDGDVEMDEATGNYSGSVGSVAGAVGSVSGAVGSVSTPVTVGTNNDKADYALSGAGVTAVQSGLATAANVSDAESNIRDDTEDLQTQVGTAGAGLTAIGDTRLGNLDAAVSSRLAAAGYTAPDNVGIAAIQAKTDNLPASPAAVGSEMTLTSAYDNAKTALTSATIIDGTVTFKTALECLMAFVGGKATVVDNGATRTITFYHRDGTTPILRLLVSETDGSRASGGTIDP